MTTQNYASEEGNQLIWNLTWIARHQEHYDYCSGPIYKAEDKLSEFIGNLEAKVAKLEAIEKVLAGEQELKQGAHK